MIDSIGWHNNLSFSFPPTYMCTHTHTHTRTHAHTHTHTHTHARTHKGTRQQPSSLRLHQRTTQWLDEQTWRQWSQLSLEEEVVHRGPPLSLLLQGPQREFAAQPHALVHFSLQLFHFLPHPLNPVWGFSQEVAAALGMGGGRDEGPWVVWSSAKPKHVA